MKSRNLRIVYAFLGLVFLVGTLAAASQIARLAETGGIAAADERLADMAPGFLLLRFCLYAAAVAGWSWWVGAAPGKRDWSASQRASVERLRWRLPVWFLVYEIAFPQRGLAGLFRLLFG